MNRRTLSDTELTAVELRVHGLRKKKILPAVFRAIGPTVGSAAWVVLLVVASACGSSEDDSRPLVRDSAEVRLVEYSRLSDQTAFVISQPLYRIGWKEEDPALEQPRYGTILSDLGVAVADSRRREVLFLRPDGGVSRVVGGPGEGPGELRQVRFAGGLPGDTVAVQDPGNGRVMFYTAESEPMSVRPRDPSVLVSYAAIGFGPGASLYMIPGGFSPNCDDPWLSIPLMRLDLPDSRLDTLLTFDWLPRITPNPIHADGSVAVGMHDIVVVRGDRAEIRLAKLDGSTRSIVRWTESPRPYTDSLWTSFARWYREAVVDRPAQAVEQELARMRPSAGGPVPYLGRVLADSEGNVWVAQYNVDPRFDRAFRVFAEDGEYLGQVEMPARFRVLDIAFGHMLGVYVNDLDVPAVALHRIGK